MRLKIVHDEHPESPREWSNLGTMICFHPHGNLGDRHGYPEPLSFVYGLACETDENAVEEEEDRFEEQQISFHRRWDRQSLNW